MKMRAGAKMVALVTVCAALLLAGCSQVSVSPVGETGELVTVTGTVQSVDVSDMAVDGPARIRLRTEQHGRVLVLVAACEGPCSLRAVQQLGQVEQGERWRVTAEVDADGDLLVYEDESHSMVPAGSD